MSNITSINVPSFADCIASQHGEVRGSIAGTFLPIEGFEDYCINEAGEVRRISTDRVQQTYVAASGYCKVTMSRPGKHGIDRVGRFVHRLLLQAHAPEAGCEDLVVNHRNGDKTDNRLSNLEFCTQAENTAHAITVLGNKGWPARSRRVIRTCRGRVFSSMTAAAKGLRVSVTTISLALKHGWKVKGYQIADVTAELGCPTTSPSSRRVVTCTGRAFSSMKVAACALGVSAQTISRAVKLGREVNGVRVYPAALA